MGWPASNYLAANRFFKYKTKNTGEKNGSGFVAVAKGLKVVVAAVGELVNGLTFSKNK